MPWRETNDPYKIWLSEVMLQQTQVNTVRSYYKRFIKQYPTIESLSRAPVEEVMKYWEGLGYYSRVRNFHTAVREVQEIYGGIVPNDGEQFLKLKGVGPYTQGAVMSIAYNLPYPAVDGNVYRVFSRLDNDDFDISKSSARKHFEQKVLNLMPDTAGDYNEALMELGATICTPKNPLCLMCPVQMHCESFVEGTVLERPVKTKKVKRSIKKYDVAVIVNRDDKVLMEQRPHNGLLATMWQFPMFDEGTSLADIEHELGLSLHLEEQSLTLTHKFSHLDWILDVYYYRTTSKHAFKGEFLTKQEKSAHTLPKIMNDIFTYYENKIK